jgi:3-phenylpropionate/trans-cinnamate dioxygenase ferredoxin subunit
MPRHVVATTSEIQDGGRKVVTLGGREIVLFRVGGEFFALLNRCPHEGAKLCGGRLVGMLTSDEPGRYGWSRPNEILRCPWHGWEFDIRTGQSFADPNKFRTRSFPVAIEPGALLVKGPYTAERFDVSVEENYVLIEA